MSPVVDKNVINQRVRSNACYRGQERPVGGGFVANIARHGSNIWGFTDFDRLFEIEFLAPGVEALAFTFG